MTGTARVAVILNPAGGASGLNAVEHIQQQLAGSSDARVLVITPEAQPESLARQALSDGCDVIVAGGGDGTLGSIAGVLAGTRATLGVLPLGTLNHFARDLGIPLDLDAALRIIQQGKTAEIDAGEVNGRIFLNNSGLGLYPGIVKERAEMQRDGIPKWPAFAWALVKMFARFPYVHASLKVDGDTVHRRTPFLFIGNNQYEIEGAQIGTRRRLDAGCLSVYTANRTGRLRLLRLAMRALAGRLKHGEDFEALITTEILVQSGRRRLHVSLDGEVVTMEPPLRYSVRPRALRVIVP